MSGGNTGLTLGIVRGISYGVFGPPDECLPQARTLGAKVFRVAFTWHQIEPQPGSYDWSAVDALLAQVEPGDQLWVTVVSASMPRDLAAYQLFVGGLVSRCHGPAIYWQCNNEPSNPALWSGTAGDYAELATVFARTVRQVDPAARVVLGGCGYDVLSAAPGSGPRAFFDEVLAKAADAFDLFDVHLYDAPQHIDAHIREARFMMLGQGIEKPIVVGEYGGPTLHGFPELGAIMQQVMSEAFAHGGPLLDSADLAKADDTPDRRAMRVFYDQMAELPPQLQMFMQGCPPALDAKRHRIACREIVTRNLYAMAGGVELTLAWNLAPEAPNYRDRLNLMGFISDKLALMDYQRGELTRREPTADAFARFAELMSDATAVRRIDTDLGIVAMEVSRERGPLFVFWTEAEPFMGDDQPPTLVEWPWAPPSAHMIDVFGIGHETPSATGTLSLGVSVTPLFVWP